MFTQCLEKALEQLRAGWVEDWLVDGVRVGRSEPMGRASGWKNFRVQVGKTDRIQGVLGVENPSLPGLMWVPGQMVDPLPKKKRNLWTLGGVSW